MAGFREFNLSLGAALLLCVGLERSYADDIRKWTDADGNLHYSVTGSEKPGPASEAAPVLRVRIPSDDERFSTQASLRRRAIEDKLTTRAAALDRLRDEAEKTRAKHFSAWVPTTVRSPEGASASLEAQRDALLASNQFEQEKTETLRRLRREERQALKDLSQLWKDFAALGAEVRVRYGQLPIWFRDRLACGTCPTAGEVEAALHPKKVEPPPTQSSSSSAPGSASGEDDEDWGEDEEWK